MAFARLFLQPLFAIGVLLVELTCTLLNFYVIKVAIAGWQEDILGLGGALGKVHLNLHIILLRISRGVDHHLIANAHVMMAFSFGGETLTEMQGYAHTFLWQIHGLVHDVYF